MIPDGDTRSQRGNSQWIASTFLERNDRPRNRIWAISRSNWDRVEATTEPFSLHIVLLVHSPPGTARSPRNGRQFRTSMSLFMPTAVYSKHLGRRPRRYHKVVLLPSRGHSPPISWPLCGVLVSVRVHSDKRRIGTRAVGIASVCQPWELDLEEKRTNDGQAHREGGYWCRFLSL